MSEIVNQSLQKIAKGTGIVFIGTIIGMGLAFLGRVLIARFFTPAEYGIFSLGYALLYIFVIISLLGLQEGATRQIAYYRGKNEDAKVRGVTFSSILIVVISSIILSIVLFFLSNILSTKIFHDPAFFMPLRIFALTIPFLALIYVFVSIFRGFDKVKERIYFQDILRNILFVLFLIAVILFGLSFINVIYAYLASIAITCIAFAIYALKKSPLPINRKRENNINFYPMTKELISFSVPLLAVSTLMMVMSWTDTLMLGYFKTSAVVGLYNAALPLAHLLSLVIASVGFLYIPLMSQFYSKNQIEELGRNYAITTKWSFLGTLPIFFLLFLFPDIVLNLLFGSRYIGAAIALQILAFGFIFNSYFGTNYHTLIAVGKSKFILQCFLASSAMNIILNLLLIPSFGINGAAIASAVSFAGVTILETIKIYKSSGLHPFTKNYLKITVLSFLTILGFYVILKAVPFISYLTILIFFPLFLIIYGLLIIFTKSFDKEDIEIVLEIEKKSTLNLTIIKKILRKFM